MKTPNYRYPDPQDIACYAAVAASKHINLTSLPEPRPLQHGFEAISWHDAPICELYGIPGEGRHSPKN